MRDASQMIFSICNTHTTDIDYMDLSQNELLCTGNAGDVGVSFLRTLLFINKPTKGFMIDEEDSYQHLAQNHNDNFGVKLDGSPY